MVNAAVRFLDSSSDRIELVGHFLPKIIAAEFDRFTMSKFVQLAQGSSQPGDWTDKSVAESDRVQNKSWQDCQHQYAQQGKFRYRFCNAISQWQIRITQQRLQQDKCKGCYGQEGQPMQHDSANQ